MKYTMSRFAGAVLAGLLVAGTPNAAGAADASNMLDALADQKDKLVTVDNFVRVESNIQMDRYYRIAGGVNEIIHFRAPTPIDKQSTIRMNRDTLYSFVVLDVSKGAEITLPDSDGRYMTAMVINQDHYIQAVLSKAGTHTLTPEKMQTPYVMVVARILVDAGDEDDVAKVNALQDKIKVAAKSSRPFVMPSYDEESYDRIFKLLIELARSSVDSARTFGDRDHVDPVRHLLGTASGWAGLSEEDAVYENNEPGLPVGAYKINVKDVPVNAFWSVSLYNADGFFEKNSHGGYIVNSVMAKKDDDGGVTIHLGGCDDGRKNCLPIMEGWNYTVRLYQPGPEILNGEYTFPTPVAVTD